MKLIAGIGNPSPEYALTRHNAGFMAVDRISSGSGIALDRKKHRSFFGRGEFGGEDILLVKPLTFVNLTGEAVRSFVKYYPLDAEDILLIHDDMDVPLGRMKLKKGGSSAGHGGVESVIRCLGTRDFARMRIGIGSSSGGRGTRFVLGKFTAGEREMIEDVLAVCTGAALEFAARGIESAMNRFNKNPERKGS